MNYTTIEQSKKLLELGLSPETADMCYPLYGIAKPEGKYPILKQKNVEGIPNINIPCWSVGALLELMPEQIAYSDFIPFPLGLFKGNKEEHSKYGHYWIQYFATDSGGAYVQTNGHSSLEAAFNMVIWLLENGYIKN